MPDGYEYIPERDQYVDQDDLAMQRRGMERAAPLREAMENAARQLQRLAGAFLASGATLDYYDEPTAEGARREMRL